MCWKVQSRVRFHAKRAGRVMRSGSDAADALRGACAAEPCSRCPLELECRRLILKLAAIDGITCRAIALEGVAEEVARGFFFAALRRTLQVTTRAASRTPARAPHATSLAAWRAPHLDNIPALC